MKQKLSLIIFLFVIVSVNAQQTNNQKQSQKTQSTLLSYAQQDVFHSKILNEDRTINIYLPKSFHNSSVDHTYPLIMVYGDHGDQFFLTTSGLVEHLSSVNRMPEAIIISFHNALSYAPDIYTNGMWGANMEMLISDTDTDKFVQHLEEELFPYFKKNYRAADYRMIVGVSGSSIFPLHTFAKHPNLFQTQIILAGADIIGMGYKPNKTFIDAFVERLSNPVSCKSNLYFGVAENDLSWDVVYQENIDALMSRLKPFEGDNLKLKVEVIPNEVHYDSYIKAMLSAFEFIFPKQIWATEYVDLIAKKGNAMHNIDVFHQRLSSEYGFTILPKVERWNDQNSLDKIGYRLIRKERKKEAIEIFERIVEYRPRSAKALNNLAKAFEADNQSKKALIIQEKAVTLAKEFDKDNLKQYKERVEEIKAKITNSKDD
jgi:predicted alpha/beta superfamily hydrolase